MIRFFSMLAGCLMLLAGMLMQARAQSGFDRVGGDYSRFVVPSGDPKICAARCEREGRCRAWTFSYPKTAGANALCWLKSEVKPLVADACCISGVKGGSVVEPHKDSFEFAIDRFGASAPAGDLFPAFGFTAAHVASVARQVMTGQLQGVVSAAFEHKAPESPHLTEATR